MDICKPTWIKHVENDNFTFTTGQRGCTLLTFQGFNYVKNRRNGLKTYWICAKKVNDYINYIDMICLF